MSRIFVSYRRDDTQGEAGHLLADLRRRFGDERVFMDIAGIGPGEDFGSAIERAIAGCSVVLVLIGRNWLDVRDAQGRRRLDDPSDWVRLEVEAALQGSRLVIPVLVQGTSMPVEAKVPESMRGLARRNAHEISARRWDFDFDSLAKSLAASLGVAGGRAESPPVASGSGLPHRSPATRILWIAGTAAVIAVGVAAVLLQGKGDGDGRAVTADKGDATARRGVTESFFQKPPSGDFEKTPEFVAFARLNAGLAGEQTLTEAQARDLARARNRACLEADIPCRQAVLMRVRATLEAICRRKVPSAASDASEAARLRADIDFQGCMQSMEAPMLDETLQRARDSARSIKAG